MALSKYTKDTAVIENVGTNPEDRTDLNDTTFKRKWDENATDWKAFFNGVTSAEIDALILGLANSISNMTETAELTPLNGWGSPWGHPFRATRIGTIVVIEGVISGGGTNSGTVITTLPPGFRPGSERLGNVKQHENNEWVNVSIGADGHMTITSSHAWGAGVKILQFVYSLN